jgi:hypothetical protein
LDVRGAILQILLLRRQEYAKFPALTHRCELCM